MRIQAYCQGDWVDEDEKVRGVKREKLLFGPQRRSQNEKWENTTSRSSVKGSKVLLEIKEFYKWS